MNNHPSMNHHHMASQIPYHYISPTFTNISYPSTNRFIYVKHNFLNPNPSTSSKVLVNPHFKKTVYVNPQFKPHNRPDVEPPPLVTKPKIHVNPNMLKNFAKPVPSKETKPTTRTVISTRNKLVRIPCNNASPLERKRRNSLHTKYKIVRSGASPNKFKLDKRDRSLSKPLKSVRKKYVYVNRFLSMDLIAKSVLVKNSNFCKPGFVKINGILYKKSPNSLKKQLDSSTPRTLKTPRASNLVKKNLNSSKIVNTKYKLVRKLLNSSNRSIVKQYKIIRSKKLPTVRNSASKMRKCNIPCPTFRRYGKCPRKVAGTCFKLHNPDQIILCTRFLQGACRDENCLLSHKVSLEKMPTCKYFLEGLCSKDNCPYLHVKISSKADICRNFLEGFCKEGAKCNKRHQFLCPDFEKNKKCVKRKCPYPHGNAVRKTKVLNIVAKKCSMRKKIVRLKEVKDAEANRYYKERETLAKNELGEVVIKTVARERPKLGDLPVFIPFFDGT